MLSSSASVASQETSASTRTAASTRSAPARIVPSRRSHAAPANLGSAMYIGPWQEFALGRALSQNNRGLRRGVPSVQEEPGPSGFGTSEIANLPTDADLAKFVETFKDVASQLDEEGAKNLLMWSPLFMPTVQTLLQPGGAAAVPAPSNQAQRIARDRVASEVARGLSATAKGSRNGSATAARPKQKSSGAAKKSAATDVRAQRDDRLERLRKLYGCGGVPPAEAAEGGSAAAVDSGDAASAVSPAAVPLANVSALHDLDTRESFAASPVRSPSRAARQASATQQPQSATLQSFPQPSHQQYQQYQQMYQQTYQRHYPVGEPRPHSPVGGACAPAASSPSRSSLRTPPRSPLRWQTSKAEPKQFSSQLAFNNATAAYTADMNLLTDEWEDEVDDLLEWTKALPDDGR
uniref:Uncharacterized protein n=1 Tax=Chrysotila carterae TaxID=13221 RepID=A0A7S4FB52_CHRCT